MEDFINDQKNMVREVLKESKTPLMAKKIAQLIYRKFNGYRMSRFVVRDILWKEMKGEVLYDKDKYTYQLKTKNENKSKDPVDLKRLYIPIIFNIPDKKIIEKNYNFYKNQLLDKYDLVLPYDINEIDVDKWMVIFESLMNSYKDKGILRLKDQVNFLINGITEKYNYYSQIIDNSVYENNVVFDNKDFQEIFDEITRDNLITTSEKNYLIEKGKEYRISINDINRSLDKLDFKAYRSFRLLIDQICSDGVITENEREYINEKATEYNVDKRQLDQLISLGLKKVHFIDECKGAKKFEDYLDHLFISLLLGGSFDNELFEFNEQINDKNTFFTEEVELIKKEINEKLLNDYLINQPFNKVKFISIVKNFTTHKKEGNKSAADLINKSLKKIRINDISFIIKKIKIPFHPLNSYEFKRETGDNILIINESHDLYSKESENLLIKLSASIYYTKLTMTDPNIDRYINRINNNLELVENE